MLPEARKLTVDACVQAFPNTGVCPRRGTYGHFNSQTNETCGCLLTVLYLETHAEWRTKQFLDNGIKSGELHPDAVGLRHYFQNRIIYFWGVNRYGMDFTRGLVHGFDNSSPSGQAPKDQTTDYYVGFEIGRKTAERVLCKEWAADKDQSDLRISQAIKEDPEEVCEVVRNAIRLMDDVYSSDTCSPGSHQPHLFNLRKSLEGLFGDSVSDLVD